MGLVSGMKRLPANESVQVAVVGSEWGIGDKTNGTVIDCIHFRVGVRINTKHASKLLSVSQDNHSCVVIRIRAVALEKMCSATQPAVLESISWYFDGIQ